MRLEPFTKWIFFVIFFILCGTSSQMSSCGKRKILAGSQSPQSLIVGGTEARPNSWPWIVSLTRGGSIHCAGSIIDKYWILTAAHCLVQSTIPANFFTGITINVADHRTDTTSVYEYSLTSVAMYIHPKYYLNGPVYFLDYDVALMKLPTPLNFTERVLPVCLPSRDDIFNENDTCFVIGWGRTASGSTSPYLQQVKLDIISLQECNSFSSFNGRVSPRSVCGGRRSGGVSACNGDSGGPYQCKRNNTWIQLGIVSWGAGLCEQARHYSVFMDVRKFLEPFIETIQRGQNINLTMYYLRAIGVVFQNLSELYSSNLSVILTNNGEFSDIDMVGYFRALPYQIELVKKTTLIDLITVSGQQKLTSNTTTIQHIASVFFRYISSLYADFKCGRSGRRTFTPDSNSTIGGAGSCSFENGIDNSRCTWKNVNYPLDNFDWTIYSGSTLSSSTGPSSDRRGSICGKYIYIETSSPRVLGDKAWLVSNYFNTTTKCFTFWYHMYGSTIGSLNIYQQYMGGRLKLLWTLVGNRGNQWNRGQVTTKFTEAKTRIIVEGVRGSRFRGDIALDDFVFLSGSCDIHPTYAEPRFMDTTATISPTPMISYDTTATISPTPMISYDTTATIFSTPKIFYVTPDFNSTIGGADTTATISPTPMISYVTPDFNSTIGGTDTTATISPTPKIFYVTPDFNSTIGGAATPTSTSTSGANVSGINICSVLLISSIGLLCLQTILMAQEVGPVL
ncbi:uncharacterized protein LOC124453273 isoform X2 [Xenia sp. Carnegie-2017]|uniref:uncharacterized protein LOC124453273 isoform X2 n=1 Tax=Xenia sp. Carnegie-2017 TaxID=2897299 RepID=UPI001F040DD8|nr:uncharacterized protein LOC124453273 isoform X2 [Xenia sp. Carnegie-2017]